MRLRVSLGTVLGVFLAVAIARVAQAQTLSLFSTGDHLLYVPSSSGLSYQQVGYLRGATGALAPIPASTNSCNHATSAVVDSGMRYLFVTNSASGKVCVHRITPSTYALKPAGSPFGSGSNPSGITLDPSGRFLFTSNASSSNVSAYVVDLATGTLTAAPGSPFAAGSAPSAVVTGASGRFVYVANNASANVSGFALNQSTGVLTPMAGSPFPTLGHGPVAIAADPLGRFLYVANAASSDLSVFNVGANGQPHVVPGSPFPLASSPVGVAADPSGRFLYVLGAGVSGFRVNGDGSLSSLGGPVPAAGSPVAIAADLSGRFVYVANAGPASVSGYTLDEPAGTLTPIPGFPFPVGGLPADVAMSGSMPSNDSGHVGVWYSNNVTAGGGRPPYVFSIDGGVLPPGLNIGPKTGLISGTPSAAGSYTFTVRVYDGNSATKALSLTLVIVEESAPSIDLFLPSSARTPGTNGAYYTTDLTVANTGTSDAVVTFQFLGHDQNGTSASQENVTVDAGRSVTYADVLSSLFGRLNDYGAIRISSTSASIVALGQTSTPSFGGTFGQSVPAARPSDLVTAGSPRSIVGVREDSAFRSNLILNNTTASSLEVDVVLIAADGTTLGSKGYTLPPLSMTQATRVVRDLGVSGDVVGARLVLSTPTPGGAFAAYAAAIDNVTNDPRTLLPSGPLASPASTNVWLLPSSAHAPGANGAFYTTDLTVANTGGADATFTLTFLGHDQDGTSGVGRTFALAAGRSATYTDVLGSVFGQNSAYGAIQISSDAASLAVLGQTSTPGFGGTFGQSVPAAAPEDLVTTGAPRSLVAVREDDAFRTNLILANVTGAPLDVDVALVADSGDTLGTKRYSLLPLGMTQVSHVVRDLGVATNVSGARLVLSTPTAGGAFAAYAPTIDNTTNDPRTLLPR
ncbi:MAG: beta-propeller fold lactonase family protein [Thermoplasmata archaeon]|nr:beta-propeller fold lactonase family protein [Thermoplasmata archaeon]